MNTKNRIVKAGAISPTEAFAQPAPIEEIVPPAPDVTIDAQPIEEVVPEIKAPRAKKEAAEPRPATHAEMMAQSLRNHVEHTNRAAAIAELQKQLKNL